MVGWRVVEAGRGIRYGSGQVVLGACPISKTHLNRVKNRCPARWNRGILKPMPAGDELNQPSSASGPHKGNAGSTVLEGLTQARAVYLRFVEVVEDDGRYPLEAYRFLQEGLEYAVRRSHGPDALEQPGLEAPEDDPRHVDGGQLSLSLRDLALERWGRLAKAVLNGWGIHTTRDFGEMVFVLVANQFLHKTDHDRLEDFEHVFSFSDFESLYAVPYRPLHRSDFEYVNDNTASILHGGLA